MKTLVLSLFLLVLSGCATSVPYDEQFVTMKVKLPDGRDRAVMWELGPSREQAARARSRVGLSVRP